MIYSVYRICQHFCSVLFEVKHIKERDKFSCFWRLNLSFDISGVILYWRLYFLLSPSSKRTSRNLYIIWGQKFPFPYPENKRWRCWSLCFAMTYCTNVYSLVSCSDSHCLLAAPVLLRMTSSVITVRRLSDAALWTWRVRVADFCTSLREVIK